MNPRLGGRLILIGAALLCLFSLTEVLWPAQVSDERASYPFDPSMHTGVQLATAASDVLVAVGLVITLLSGPRIDRAWVRMAAWALVVAFAIFIVGQAVEASLANEASADAEAAVGPLFGAGSLLWGAAGIAAGIGLLRNAAWKQAGLMILISGVALFAIVLPTQFGAPPRIADLALALWSATVVSVGVAVQRQRPARKDPDLLARGVRPAGRRS